MSFLQCIGILVIETAMPVADASSLIIALFVLVFYAAIGHG